MKVRQATLQAPNTNTTQNYTVSGFGTPTAAIIMWSKGNTAAWGNDGNIGMGFWDGTDQRCVTAGYDHGDTLDSGSGRQAWDPANVVWMIINGGSTNERKASITGTVTDGLTLTWTGEAPSTVRPYVTVILINGINGAKTGFRTASDTDTGTTQTTTTGITPKLILFAGRLSASDTASHGSGPRVMFGFACNNGSTIDNYTHGLQNRHDLNPTDCNGAVRDDGCFFLDYASNNWCAVTTMTSGSFTTTSDINGTVFASSHHYLALDFDESVVGWGGATPTTSGDWDPFTASFTPQWAFMIPTGFAALNTNYGADQDGVESHHLYSVIKNPASSAAIDEDSHNVVIENGSTTTVYAQSRHDTTLRIDRVSGTPGIENFIIGSNPTFDSSGIVYADADITHDIGQAHQVVGFFVEEGASTTSGLPSYRGSNRGVARGVARGVG